MKYLPGLAGLLILAFQVARITRMSHWCPEDWNKKKILSWFLGREFKKFSFEPHLVAHSCNPSIWEIDAGGC
jgi:hypothetical protein